MNLKGKAAVVTGSSSGIGEAIALSLASEGVKVVVNSRKNVVGGVAGVDKIKKFGGDAFYVQADVSIRDEVRDLLDKSLTKYKHIDILVNNAGESKKAVLGDLNNWNYQFNNILMSSVVTSDEFLRIKSNSMRKIVNISS